MIGDPSSVFSITGLLLGLLVTGLVLAALLYMALRQRNAHLWLGDYARQFRARRSLGQEAPIIDVLVCVADHYEPRWDTLDPALEADRVARWVRELPETLQGRHDSDGRPPQHSFFYPYEEYREELLDELTGLCARGYGEIEIHLHHGHDTADTLRVQLDEFAKLLHWRHGALGTERESGKPGYAFIHGNWALNNSGDSPEICGVNDEISVLLQTGCYVDMTLPSAPSDSQVNLANRIYYARSTPDEPTGHRRGEWVRAGGSVPSAQHMMLITGPLGLNWRDRKFGLLPRIENGELSDRSVASPHRIRLWHRLSSAVEGRPEWRFIKLHCHGAQEKDHGIMLGEECRAMYEELERQFRDTPGYRLHYVNAREMFNIARAAEAGRAGNPDAYRDYVYAPPKWRLNESATGLSAGR